LMSGDQSTQDLANQIIRRLDEFKGRLESYQDKVRKAIAENDRS